MGHTFRQLALAVLAVVTVVPTASRAFPAVALAPSVSSLGVGAQATMEIIPNVNVRLLAQGFGFSASTNKDGIHYDGYARLFTGGALFDIYPLVWGPRISVGLMGNANEAFLNAECEKSSGCTVQGVNISNAQNAHVSGVARFNVASPYAGLGWGNAMLGHRLYVSIDAGVMYQGKPKVNLHAYGTATVTDLRAGVIKPNDNLATDPQVQAAVAEEQAVLAEDAKNFRLFPVLMLTAGWRF